MWGYVLRAHVTLHDALCGSNTSYSTTKSKAWVNP
jgi:hypothetical protein